jgi:PAS domain S-box-containing protein
MREPYKTKQALVNELESLKQRIRELEHAESDRKQAEEVIQEGKNLSESIINSLPGIFYLFDAQGKFLRWNRNFEIVSGYSHKEILERHPSDFFTGKEKEMVQQSIRDTFVNGEANVEARFVSRNGAGAPYFFTGVRIEINGQPHLIGMGVDITEREQAENALRESEERYRELTDFLPISISTFEVNAAGIIISFNRTALEVFGYNEEDYKEGMNALQFFAPEEWQRVGENMGNVIQGTSTPGQEFTFLRKDGSKFIGLIYASPIIHQNKTVGIRGVIIDITERKRAEEALRESEKRFKNLYQEGPIPTFTWQKKEDDFILVDFNRAALQITNGKVVDQLGNSALKLYKNNPQFVSDMNLCCKEQSVVRREIVSQHFAPGRILSVHYGFIPPDLIIVHTEDQTDRKRAEEKLRESLEQLRRAMQTTIQVLVMAVEMKDPYTAGHQRRMTNLARTMAREMGLPPEKIEGLRMAGIIHDIGKITLPTEILSKPTKLSAIELSLIRENVRLGYDILKDVESPWPLAEIVLQHHERMDGSGYPRGLKGEEILIEARILAVADVVEAMASHRPYRAALGLDAALEEIEKNKGLLYDSHAVDTCLRVFREKGYQIEGA